MPMPSTTVRPCRRDAAQGLVFDLDDNLLQTVEFHTSCSQPLFTGDEFGSLRIIDCVDENAGSCCVDGKPRVLTMQYTGEGCDASSHIQDPGKVSCDGDPAFEPTVRIRASDKEDPEDGTAKVWFDDTVALGGTFDADAFSAGEASLANTTFIHVFDLDDNLLQTVEFHTSCSQPLYNGNQFGSALLIGCVGEDVGSCCADGSPRVLTMQYTRDGCDATSHSQDPGKVSCDGDPASEPTVRIRASDKEDPDDGKAKVWFDGTVDLGDTFDVDAENAGESHLKASTFIHVFDPDDNLLQIVEFYTSCSQPLFPDDQFGTALLVDCDGVGFPDCPWDLDGDGVVGIGDLLALLGAWGTNPGGPPDFNGDGTVGIFDFLALLANWGPCT